MFTEGCHYFFEITLTCWHLLHLFFTSTKEDPTVTSLRNHAHIQPQQEVNQIIEIEP